MANPMIQLNIVHFVQEGYDHVRVYFDPTAIGNRKNYVTVPKNDWALEPKFYLETLSRDIYMVVDDRVSRFSSSPNSGPGHIKLRDHSEKIQFTRAHLFDMLKIADKYMGTGGRVGNEIMAQMSSNAGGCTGCNACSSHDEQQKCKYYEKASFENRCMYLSFDEYCWLGKKATS